MPNFEPMQITSINYCDREVIYASYPIRVYRHHRTASVIPYVFESKLIKRCDHTRLRPQHRPSITFQQLKLIQLRVNITKTSLPTQRPIPLSALSCIKRNPNPPNKGRVCIKIYSSTPFCRKLYQIRAAMAKHPPSLTKIFIINCFLSAELTYKPNPSLEI